MHTIKTIDKEAIIIASQNSRGIITMEGHNTIGGLGSAVADVLCEKGIAISFRKIRVNDRFGIPGKTHDIFKHFLFTSKNAVKISEEIMG
ncbi:MAG: transketolase C-terminal domain-containing protein [bacterium]